MFFRHNQNIKKYLKTNRDGLHSFYRLICILLSRDGGRELLTFYLFDGYKTMET